MTRYVCRSRAVPPLEQPILNPTAPAILPDIHIIILPQTMDGHGSPVTG